MTKKLIALTAALLTAASLYLPSRAEESFFSDVTPAHWSYMYVSRAAKAGVVSGMGDGSFLPDETLTFAQFVSVIVRVCGLETVRAEGAPWYEGYIAAAGEAGLLDGVGASDPDGGITRFDMAKIVYSAMKLLGYEPLGDTEIAETAESIPDPVPDGCREAVAGVYALGIILGVDEQGSFRGGDMTTRAQCAVIYCRMMTAVESCVTAGNASYRIGMSEAALRAKAGEPHERLTAVAGGEWYVYLGGGSLFAAEIKDGKAAVLLAAGDGFSYAGFRPGDTGAETSSRLAALLTDACDEDRLYGVYITGGVIAAAPDLSPEALYGEARLNYHLVNVFRSMHGLSALMWSDAAAEAGRLHCAEMAEYGYFAHEGRNGSAPAERLEAQGINYRAAGENIYSNTSPAGGGTEAFARLVDSPGHRDTMLYEDFEYLGVSCAASAEGAVYLAEEFYKAR